MGRAGGLESRGDRCFIPHGLEGAETGYRDKETLGEKVLLPGGWGHTDVSQHERNLL